MLLIKLGGSVITHKDKPFSPNLKNLYNIARVLSDFWRENLNKEIIIVHGGGSFAHVVASQYTRYFPLTSENRRGISLISWSARKLNDRVVESLVDYDLPVFPLQTSSIFAPEKRGPKLNASLVKIIVGNGWIPVLYGDIIPCEGEAQIISGEKILETLCKEFDVERIIVCTNADGVLRDVNNPTTGIVDSINPKNIRSIMKTLGASSGIDVTGGMKEKVKILYRIATVMGVKSQVINGTSPEALDECLHGRNVVGTSIEGI